MKDPQAVTDKWAKRISSATDEIKAGVQAVTEAPGAAAVKKQTKLVQNWQNAVESGKWAQNTGAVTVEQWKAQMLDKGVNRIATGANAAKDKVLKFQQDLLTFEANLKTKIDQMDDSTPEARTAKSIAWQDGMRKFKRTSR